MNPEIPKPEAISQPNPNDRDRVEMREYKSAFLK